VQIGQTVGVPTLGSIVAQSPRGIDRPMEEGKPLAPVMAEPEKVSKTMGQRDDRFVESPLERLVDAERETPLRGLQRRPRR